MKKDIIVTQRDKKDEVMAFILEKEMNKFTKENPDFLKDVEDLSARIVLFNMKWGTKISPKDIIQMGIINLLGGGSYARGQILDNVSCLIYNGSRDNN